MPNLPLIRRHFSRGFTAIELMVTVAILAVLAGLAAPSFNPIIERWRVRQVSEELQSTFYFARSEAIKRGGNVTILRSDDGGGCTAVGTDTSLWSCGWIVFADLDNDGEQDSGEDTLQTAPAPNKVNVQFTNTSDAKLTDPIKVDRWGRFSSTNAAIDFAFRLTPKSGSAASASSICVSSSGRIKRLDSATGSCS
ncbi:MULTISPECIES: GspH/FimT family pseudopilin [Comamonas]|uniref:GspH/FimT family pseudopilin n=1 Tax=Comamonas TaxID=283 RepID=UPI0005A1BB03|nr:MULTISPECIES: GspH/FimT family pseudopilin [Comamonas]MDO1474393.1 prepilin-type N-terminal cleavage/methylation domain-containing protein [Comamonas thiooxydans]QOQ83385.1 GspH/FimT family pseudopilin [Comamonas thiooxydans]